MDVVAWSKILKFPWSWQAFEELHVAPIVHHSSHGEQKF